MSWNEQNRSRTGVDRLVGFSDGVFAIAITLLVLNIDSPAGTGSMAHIVLSERSAVLTYVISFLVIGNYWIAHHHLFQRIDRQDDRLLWLNLLFLLCVAFVPFPTALLGDAISTATVSIYAITLVAVSVLSAGLWWYASGRSGLISTAVTPAQRRTRVVRSLAPAMVFALSVPIAVIRPIWGMYFWLMLAAADPVLDRFLALS